LRTSPLEPLAFYAAVHIAEGAVDDPFFKSLIDLGSGKGHRAPAQGRDHVGRDFIVDPDLLALEGVPVFQEHVARESLGREGNTGKKNHAVILIELIRDVLEHRGHERILFLGRVCNERQSSAPRRGSMPTQ